MEIVKFFVKTLIVAILAIGLVHLAGHYLSAGWAYAVITFFVMLGIDKIFSDYSRFKRMQKIQALLSEMEDEYQRQIEKEDQK